MPESKPEADQPRSADQSPPRESLPAHNGGANGSPTNGDTATRESDPEGGLGARLRSMHYLAFKYNFTPPDDFVGDESSEYVLDYGRPIVLADSSREAYRARSERTLLKRIFHRP